MNFLFSLYLTLRRWPASYHSLVILKRLKSSFCIFIIVWLLAQFLAGVKVTTRVDSKIFFQIEKNKSKSKKMKEKSPNKIVNNSMTLRSVGFSLWQQSITNNSIIQEEKKDSN